VPIDRMKQKCFQITTKRVRRMKHRQQHHKNFNACHKTAARCHNQNSFIKIIKISSTVSTAILIAEFTINCQMNIYLMSTVKLNLVKFHSGTSTQTPCLAPTCSAIQLFVDNYLKDTQDKMYINNALMHDYKY